MATDIFDYLADIATPVKLAKNPEETQSKEVSSALSSETASSPHPTTSVYQKTLNFTDSTSPSIIHPSEQRKGDAGTLPTRLYLPGEENTSPLRSQWRQNRWQNLIVQPTKDDQSEDASDSGKGSDDVDPPRSRSPPKKKTQKITKFFRLNADDDREFDDDSERVSPPSSSNP